MYWNDYIKFWFTIGSRYFIIAGIAFIIFYILLKEKHRYRKIQIKNPSGSDLFREIIYSLATISIFAAVPLVMLKIPAIARHTQFYPNIDLHGWLYFFIAFPLMFFLHDTYFYWTHRLMHHKKLFKVFHLIHHRSTNPSPWAAYAFHPLEALNEAGIFVLFLFVMPIHILHLAIFFFLMIVYNIYGHLGYELYPAGFQKSMIGKWINTSVSHNQHHQYFNGNYGLYFTFWDRMMGTLRNDYSERFDEVTSRASIGSRGKIER